MSYARVHNWFTVTIAAAFVVASMPSHILEARQGGAPGAPVDLVATVTGSAVTLQWRENTSGAAPSLYWIYAGSAPGRVDLAAISTATTSLTASAPPGTYYVRVIAVNANGASPPSNEVVITVGGGCAFPGAPSGLTSAVDGGTVMLQWNAPATGGTASAYTLLVGSVPGAADLGTFPVGNTLSFTAVAPPGTYYVRVVATNACGSSTPSGTATVIVNGGGPGGLPAGVYIGSISGHRPPPGRAQITSFSLTLNQALPSSVQLISARWSDSAGCVQTGSIYGGLTANGPLISIERLRCNDGDFSLQITSSSGNTYGGVCDRAGCTFTMSRQ